MTKTIPKSMLHWLDSLPSDQPVLLLLRHSVRGHLPLDDTGYTLSITPEGHKLAMLFGVLLQNRLQTLHTSPLIRCVQTATAIKDGARADISITHDHHLGDPGVYVLDGELAWENWKQLGDDGVMKHMISSDDALPGMEQSDVAAHRLIHHMLTIAGGRPGIHVFVTHDALVTISAARLLKRVLGLPDRPKYLEGVFFWQDNRDLHIAYKNWADSLPLDNHKL